MPPRRSQPSVQSKKPRAARKGSNKRSLDAFAIAAAENPERTKVRKHRLGDEEVWNHQRKRQRLGSDDEESGDEDLEDRRRPRGRPQNRGGDSDVEEGSDSDGNTWQMGHVDEDDDSDIDSDEAFGESDEERFEGFTFRGSSSGKKKNTKVRAGEDDDDIDLNEEEEEEEDDDESLGEDAVDLATMLDNYEDSENEGHEESKDRGKHDHSSTETDDEEDSEFDESESEDDEDVDGDGQLRKIQQLLSSLDQEASSSSGPKARGPDAYESNAPTESVSTQKVSLDDLLSTISDPQMKKASKLLQEDSKPSKRNGIPGKLDAPLPKRQQDRLDRIAANEQTKKTLERWVETVKHNRRAEHLSFPLKDPDATEPDGQSRFVPVSKPANDLESAIQNILHESGLAGADGNDDEEQIRKYEELQAKKLPLEEVMRRRAELRKARELLFREEVRAKRIKKIKSKAYRRVHRKEREREMQREKELLAADGMYDSEEEKERHDRMRAEERMGAKHRESKWAKGMKKSGRTVWDEDARSGVTEMARRNEELRRRIEGKDIRNDDDSDFGDFHTESDEEDADSDTAETKNIQRQLARLGKSDEEMDGAGSKLAGMAFMKRAEAARKAQNDEEIARIRRELGDQSDEGSNGSDGDENALNVPGRRKYAPSTGTSNLKQPAPKTVNEFEEKDDSEEVDDTRDEEVNGTGPTQIPTKQTAQSRGVPREQKQKTKAVRPDDSIPAENPWLSGKKRKEPKNQALPVAEDISLALENPWLTADAPDAKSQKPSKSADQKTRKSKNSESSSGRKEPGAEILSAPDADGWVTVSYEKDEDDGNDDEADDNAESYMPFVIRNQELVRRGFAGEDVVADFEEEKNAAIEEDDEKVIDATLPGWGSWAGEGLSKRQQKRNKGKVLTKQEGIRPQDRKDAKLERVIINEKRVRKNVKYMADTLPHQFESKVQYERSLRLPKGPEWQTKQTYQDGTKPRVLVKQGVILPPTKPLV